jgi:hypothetical protein
LLGGNAHHSAGLALRVLVDEQLPRQLALELTSHEVRTVQQEGWAGLKNGELLRRAAEQGFQVFLTADQNLACCLTSDSRQPAFRKGGISLLGRFRAKSCRRSAVSHVRITSTIRSVMTALFIDFPWRLLQAATLLEATIDRRALEGENGTSIC